MSILSLIPAGLFVTTLCYCVWTDLRTHKIRNLAVLIVLLAGVAWQFLQAGWQGLGDGLLGMLLGFAVFLPIYIKRITSAGDVKLMAACGMFLGFDDAVYALAITLISGAVYALVIITIGGGLKSSLQRWIYGLRALVYRNKNLYIPPAEGDVAAGYFPYALAIVTGALAPVIIRWLAP